MNSMTTNHRIVFGSLVAVVLVIALAFATGAVGSATSHDAEVTALKQQVAALQKEAKRTQAVMRSQIDFLSVSTRVAFINAAGMHAMEARYNTTGLTSRDIEAIQNVLVVSSKIGWPAALEGDAATLVKSCREFLAAWNSGNKAEAFTKLQAAHEAYHGLVAFGYKWLS